MLLTRRRLLRTACVAGCALLGGGCRRKPADSALPSPSELARLPGLRGCNNAELKAELARIVEEKGTPEQLTAQHCTVQAKQFVGALVKQIEPERCEQLLSQAAGVLSQALRSPGPVTASRLRRFATANDKLRASLRRSISSYGGAIAVRFDKGFAADLSAVDVLRLASRLEAVRSLERLYEADLPESLAALRIMFDAAAIMDRTKHPVVRLEAAFVRTEALQVLQQLVTYPDVEAPLADKALLEAGLQTLKNVLFAWPPDAWAWIGDRALGLYAYELVRAGMVSALLTEEERQRLADERLLFDLANLTPEQIDLDELFYLRAMRRIIAACQRPYFAREEDFQAIRSDLKEQERKGYFPLVAGRLLLPEVENGHVIQAQDRARVEAWILALSEALGETPPAFSTDPTNGQPYDIQRKANAIWVYWGNAVQLIGSPIMVPTACASDG